MLDWENLRYFAAFARSGSLAAAARVLDVDHATVARRIGALEAALSLKLVDRRPRAYVLTEEGHKVAAYAEQIAQATHTLERYAFGEQKDLSGEVVISAPPAFLGALIAPHVASLHARFPKLTLRLVGAKDMPSLVQRDADIAISLTRPEEATSIIRRVGVLRFSLYASLSWLERNSPPVYIGYDDSQKDAERQKWLERRAGSDGFVMRSNDLRIQAAAAAGGLGIVLLPRFIAQEHGLALVAPEEAGFDQAVWLAIHEDMRNALHIRETTDFISRCIEAAEAL